jgi:ABC-2 type transport system permease protein
MISALYAEFCKLLTIRSTYIISAVSLLLSGFIAFWGYGYKGGPVYAQSTFQGVALTVVSIVGIFVGIIAILLICHEYRYNTIGYSLTSSNRRLKVLLAKFVVLAGFAIIMALLSTGFAIAMVALGARVGGFSMSTQFVDVYSLLWKVIVYMIGSAWLGLILGFLSRSLVFAIVAYFVLPVIMPLAHQLLKISDNVLITSAQEQILQASPTDGVYSPLASAGVFGAYLLVGLIVAIILFLRKDAN